MDLEEATCVFSMWHNNTGFVFCEYMLVSYGCGHLQLIFIWKHSFATVFVGL